MSIRPVDTFGDQFYSVHTQHVPICVKSRLAHIQTNILERDAKVASIVGRRMVVGKSETWISAHLCEESILGFVENHSVRVEDCVQTVIHVEGATVGGRAVDLGVHTICQV